MEIKMSYISVSRLLRIAAKVKANGNILDAGERNTLRYIFKQCNPVEQTVLFNKYGQWLDFLKDEPEVEFVKLGRI